MNRPASNKLQRLEVIDIRVLYYQDSEAQPHGQLHESGLILLGGDNAEEIERGFNRGGIVDFPGVAQTAPG
jgi:hypothetical protein